jgi:hypothetical protein
MQLVFWLVPNMISSIAMFSMMGFFLGPFFAAVSLKPLVCTGGDADENRGFRLLREYCRGRFSLLL